MNPADPHWTAYQAECLRACTTLSTWLPWLQRAESMIDSEFIFRCQSQMMSPAQVACGLYDDFHRRQR